MLISLDVKNILMEISMRGSRQALTHANPQYFLLCSENDARDIIVHAKSLPTLVFNIKSSTLKVIQLHNGISLFIYNFKTDEKVLRWAAIDGLAVINPQFIPPSWSNVLGSLLLYPGLEVICLFTGDMNTASRIEYGANVVKKYISTQKAMPNDRLPNEDTTDWFKRIMS